MSTRIIFLKDSLKNTIFILWFIMKKKLSLIEKNNPAWRDLSDEF